MLWIANTCLVFPRLRSGTFGYARASSAVRARTCKVIAMHACTLISLVTRQNQCGTTLMFFKCVPMHCRNNNFVIYYALLLECFRDCNVMNDGWKSRKMENRKMDLKNDKHKI